MIGIWEGGGAPMRIYFEKLKVAKGQDEKSPKSWVL